MAFDNRGKTSRIGEEADQVDRIPSRVILILVYPSKSSDLTPVQ
ncbi:hypothetical protein [Synechococcus sp. M16CYN]